MHKLKTYIVEDSAVIRDNLIATLQELTAVQVVGFSEDEAGATAWLSQPNNQARLVIIDIFLKQGSGLGVLRSGAAQHSVPSPSPHSNGSTLANASVSADPVHRRKWVVFSNYATADMRKKCLALGADRLFDKSTEIDGLIAYCDELARGLNTQPAPLT